MGDLTFNPDGSPRRSRLARAVRRSRRRRVRRIAHRRHPANPQRLDNLVGKIIRIIPGSERARHTSIVSENGRYRIPNDNPFVKTQGRPARNLGVRPSQSSSPDLGDRSVEPCKHAG